VDLQAHLEEGVSEVNLVQWVHKDRLDPKVHKDPEENVEIPDKVEVQVLWEREDNQDHQDLLESLDHLELEEKMDFQDL